MIFIVLSFAKDGYFWMRGKPERGPNDTNCHFGIKYKKINSFRGFSSYLQGVGIVIDYTCV